MVCQNKMNKCLALILVLMSNIVLAEEDPTFKAWLAALKEEA